MRRHKFSPCLETIEHRLIPGGGGAAGAVAAAPAAVAASAPATMSAASAGAPSSDGSDVNWGNCTGFADTSIPLYCDPPTFMNTYYTSPVYYVGDTGQ